MYVDTQHVTTLPGSTVQRFHMTQKSQQSQHADIAHDTWVSHDTINGALQHKCGLWIALSTRQLKDPTQAAANGSLSQQKWLNESTGIQHRLLPSLLMGLHTVYHSKYQLLLQL